MKNDNKVIEVRASEDAWDEQAHQSRSRQFPGRFAIQCHSKEWELDVAE